jgi:DNA polymerase-3 subunit beta
MKAICEREKLLHAFQLAASVAPARSPKQILQNVKLELSAERAILMGNDLEVGIRVEAQGFAVDKPGSTILPRDRFGKILAESSDEKLSLESDGKKVTVRGQWSEFHLPCENPKEFPDVAAFESKKYHELPARAFRETVRRTVFATDNESSRYALGGVLLEMTDDGLTAVSTDGRRLTCQENPAKAVGGHASGDNATIVPARAMQLLERVLADSDENVRIAARQNDLMVHGGKVMVYTRLTEGRFPKWRDVFPRRDSMNVKVELPVGPFYAAVRQAGIVTSEERRGVDFTFGGGKVILAGHGAEMGESHVELPVAYDGPELVIALDPRYMCDFLKVLAPDQTITMELRDGDSAALCTTTDGYSYVLMPLSREQ